MEAFDVIPAIDVLEGRCVRLSEGRRERVTIEGGDPARRPRDSPQRARRGSISSTSTARSPAGRRRDSWRRVAAAGVPVQVGGGLRDVGRHSGGARRGRGSNHRRDRRALASRQARACPGFGDEARRRRRREGRPGRHRRLGDRDRGLARASSPSSAPPPACAGSSSRAPAATARSPGPDTELLADVLAAGLPVLAAGGIASLDDLRHAARPRLRGRSRRQRALVGTVRPRRGAGLPRLTTRRVVRS